MPRLKGARILKERPNTDPFRTVLLWHHGSMDHLRDVPDEPPPFLGTWRRVYVAVLVYLAVIISAFYLFTRAYR
jgi:hypothetical protein